ncbi:hypothetical protein L3X38_003700 [Prunus dulcis]|uniref:Retroviral polymerase SH3-like domain-containing protein n=1 Tax=Prunus dulcis TaxID=3755 RepID=A0AAD5F2F1_PRUDU|nr:hypothetical protein L3X38_003700 [Prunus dulcis]
MNIVSSSQTAPPNSNSRMPICQVQTVEFAHPSTTTNRLTAENVLKNTMSRPKGYNAIQSRSNLGNRQEIMIKLDPRAENCVFIGYAPYQKGYRCYHPPSQKVYTSMDVVFRKHDIYFSAVQEEHRDATTSQISRLFPSELSQPDSDRLLVESDRSPPENPNMFQNDRSPEDHDRSSPCCQT